MIWSGIIDCLIRDMTPLAGMPSYLAESPRVLLVWSSNKMPSKNVMLRIRGENMQKNTISQRTLRESIKVWRLINYEYGRIFIPPLMFYH